MYGDPAGRALLYSHGGLSCRLDVAFAADLCAERGIRLIAPDRPGIGLSDRRPNYSLTDWTYDVRHLMTFLNVQTAGLLGWSNGAGSAFACAFQMPEVFTIVGTIGGIAPFKDPNAIADLGLLVDRMSFSCPRSLRWAMRMFFKLGSLLPPKMLKWSVQNIVKSKADQRIISDLSVVEATEFVYESVRKGSDGVIDDYWAIAGDWGFPLSDIHIPVHLWHGDDDYLSSLSCSRYVAQQIPQAKLKVLEGQGHFVLRHILPEVLSTLVPD